MRFALGRLARVGEEEAGIMDVAPLVALIPICAYNPVRSASEFERVSRFPVFKSPLLSLLQRKSDR
jgi:hypothetical protein